MSTLVHRKKHHSAEEGNAEVEKQRQEEAEKQSEYPYAPFWTERFVLKFLPLF